jgi:gamma-glutamyl hercynylcysteine S-oxide synthase
MSDAARRLAGSALAEALRDARATTLARTLDRSDADWRVPQLSGINPIAWELGHLAWFAEFWVLRGPHVLGDDGFVTAARKATIAGPDAIFDSARLAHDARWRIALPTRAELVERLARQLEACIAAIPAAGTSDDAALYFHRLALFHEDMHGEAFAWLRAALSWPAPEGLALAKWPAGAPLALAGGALTLGRAADAPGFSFDNEQPALACTVAPFAIDAAPVTNAEFLAFVTSGGYDQPALWPGNAGQWRAASKLAHPQRWRRVDDRWQERWFDRWRSLDAEAPVIHVNAWEAEAYCRWAGRRLPSAAEWQFAAREPRFHWGESVWEWTADPFRPYPGFVTGPYADYSRPWFGDHRELRGGSFASHERLHSPCYRNFFTPDRSDVFAGFRTAAS